MEVVSCSSWKNFRSLLEQKLQVLDPSTRNRYIFRGQGDSKWKLNPTFDRSFPSVEKEQRMVIEEQLINNFRELSAETPTFKEAALHGDDAILAFAQHNGLPTRLLDWTESPFIASFFAFTGHLQNLVSAKTLIRNQKIAVWALDKLNHIWNEKTGVSVMRPPSAGNVRLRNQLGWFTLSKTPFSSLEEYEQFSGESKALYKFEIPAQESSVALHELEMMNLRYSTLFEDSESISKAAVSSILLDSM